MAGLRSDRTLLFRLGALALGSLSSLVLLEVGLRLVGRPAISQHTVSREDYDRIPGMWEPDQDFVNRDNPALPYSVRINSLGLRGPEATLVPSGLRVLFLGDSFTFGDFVADDETLPAQTEARLGEAVEVLNGGVGGTTIVDQRVFLERYLALAPDVVVLVFYENDLNDLLVGTPQHELLAQNRVIKSGTLGPTYRLVRNTAVFHAVLELRAFLRNLRAPRDSLVPLESEDETPSWVEETAQRYADEAAEIRDLLQARGIELVLAGFPHPFSVGGNRRRLPDRLGPVAEALAERGLFLVDLTPALEASGRPETELYLLPHDGHASPLGYGVAADALAPHVERALGRRYPSR